MPQAGANLDEIEKLIDQLSERKKIELVRRLEERTFPARWRAFLRAIDRRRKTHPLRRSEIERMVEEVRQEVYERNRR